MSKLGDEPAFPVISRCFDCDGRGVDIQGLCIPCDGVGHLHKGGLTKHELFTALAMHGMLRGKYEDAYCDIAVFAAQMADDQLAELAKEQT